MRENGEDTRGKGCKGWVHVARNGEVYRESRTRQDLWGAALSVNEWRSCWGGSEKLIVLLEESLLIQHCPRVKISPECCCQRPVLPTVAACGA